jgi:DNA-directed RNA polymerase subunit L
VSTFSNSVLQLKIIPLSKESVQVQIDGEDYSVCDIIHKELLGLKHVKFAGVAPPHPLIKTMTIQFHTDGADSNKILSEAIENAQKRMTELLELANGAFPIAIRSAAQRAEDVSPMAKAEIVEPESAGQETVEPTETRSATVQ